MIKRCIDCEELANHIYEYVDDALEGELALRLCEHVKTCEHCASLAAAESHVRELMRKSCEASAPQSLRERIHASLSVLSVKAESVEVEVHSDGVITAITASSTSIAVKQVPPCGCEGES